MNLATAKWITVGIVWGTPIIWIAWDLYVFRRFGHDATESGYLWRLYLRWHPFALLLMLAAAVLTWHFFLQ